jgi:type I restriction enzyme S subunit
MLRSQDYSKGWTGPDEMHRVNSRLQNQYKNARIRRGDLIMTIVGAGIGQVVTAPAWLDGAILSRSTARIAVDGNQASVAFVKASLESPVGRRQIFDSQKEGAQPVLSCQDLAKFFLPYPPASEQRAIAKVLSDFDALLGALKKLVTKKRDFEQAAMQQLLTGQKRLQGFGGEWDKTSFGNVLRKLNSKDYQIPTAEYQTTGILPVVDQGKDVVVGFSDREDKRFRCPTGGVIVFGDHTCIVKFVDFDFVVGADGTQILAANAGHSARFHAFDLQRRGIQSTGYNRHFKFLKERYFVAPRLEEQTAIAEVLSDMDAEIAALERRLAKTRALKQGMMQELLTGKTRLVA